MPYNPGISYNGDQALAAGMRQGQQNMLQLAMWLMDRAGKTTEMRKTVSTAFPEMADQVKDMGLNELMGTVHGKYMQEQSGRSALQDQMLKLQKDNLESGQENEQAMGRAMRQSMPSQSYMPMSGVAANAGNPLAVSIPTGQAPAVNDLVRAMMSNPGAEMTPTGRSIIADWVKGSESLKMRGTPERTTLGDTPVIFNRATGQFVVDPAYTADAKLQAKANYAPAVEVPGNGPLVKKAGGHQFYWDTHFRAWKPVTGQKSFSLFGDGEGAGGGGAPQYNSPADVQADFKAGKITYQQAYKFLQDMNGPGAGVGADDGND